MEMKIEEALEYMDLIDFKFLQAKKNKVARVDVRWGKWSREMNLCLKELQKENPFLIYSFKYWLVSSKLLDVYKKFPLYKMNLKKSLKQELMNLKKLVEQRKEGKQTFEEVFSEGLKQWK